eukprot:COSAG06_NODE_15904_length_1036_cov_1.088581_1_plen_129_part_10
MPFYGAVNFRFIKTARDKPARESQKTFSGRFVFSGLTDALRVLGARDLARGNCAAAARVRRPCENDSFAPFNIKTIILPSQARDKHRKNSKGTAVFSGTTTTQRRATRLWSTTATTRLTWFCRWETATV